MARKSNNKSTTSTDKKPQSVVGESNSDESVVVDSFNAEERVVVPSTESCDDGDVVVVTAEESCDDGDGTNKQVSSNPKTRKTVVERIDAVLKLIEDNAPVSVITKQLLSVRKTLDGAQIKNIKKSRKPNMYNMFMSEQMEKLKDQDIPATEKFKMCIKLWNERKEADAATKQ